MISHLLSIAGFLALCGTLLGTSALLAQTDPLREAALNAVSSAEIPNAKAQTGAGKSVTKWGLPPPQVAAANARRIQLIADAEMRYNAGDVVAAYSLTQAALQLDRELYGEADDRVSWRHRELAWLALELEKSDEWNRHVDDAIVLVQAAYVEGTWQRDDVQRWSETIRAIASLPRTKRQEFLQSRREINVATEAVDLQTVLQKTQLRAATFSELLGERHLATVSELLDIQNQLVQLNQTATVETQFRKLEQLIPQISVVPSPTYAALYSRWALLDEALGDDEAAERHYRRAIKLHTEINFPLDTGFSTVHNNYAVFLESMQRDDEALVNYQKACTVWQGEFSPDSWIYRTMRNNVVLLLHDTAATQTRLQNWDAAAMKLNQASEIISETWQGKHFLLAEIRADLVTLQNLRSLTPEEVTKYDRAMVLQDQGDAAQEVGEWDKALSLARESLALVSEVLDEESLPVLRARYTVVRRQDDSAPVRAQTESLLPSFEENLGLDHPEYAAVLLNLAGPAVFAANEDEIQLGIERARKAVDIFAGSYGKESWDYATALSLYGRLLQVSHHSNAADILLEAKLRWEVLGESQSVSYAEVLLDLGDHYVWFDRPAEALPYTVAAVQLVRTLPDYSQSALSTFVNQLANLYNALQRYDRAAELYAEAVTLERDASDRSECDFRMVLKNAGEVHFTLEDYDTAEKYYKELYDLCPDSTDLCLDADIDGHIYLAATYRRQERYAEAEAVLERLKQLLMDSKILSPEQLRVHLANIELNRLSIFRDSNQRKKGLDVLVGTRKMIDAIPRSALDASLVSSLADIADEFDDAVTSIEMRELFLELVNERNSGQPWIVADARCDLEEKQQRASLSPSQVKELERASELWEEAFSIQPPDLERRRVLLLRQATAIREKVLGEFHREVASSLLTLGTQERDSGKQVEAYQIYKRVISILRQILGDDHLSTAEAKVSAAIAARKTNRFPEAFELLSEALATQGKIKGKNHVELADAYHSLSILHLESGQFTSALSAALEARQRYELRDGENSTAHANALRTLYSIYDELGEYEKGYEALIRSHNIIQSLFEPTDLEYLEDLYVAGIAFSEYGSTREKAAGMFQQILDGLEAKNLQNTEEYANALTGLGGVNVDRGDYRAAQENYTRALELRKALYDNEEHILIAELYSRLGTIAIRLGELPAAEVHLKTACQMRRNHPIEGLSDSAVGFYKLAMVNALQQKPKLALEYLDLSLEIEQRSLQENFLVGSEQAVSRELDSNDEHLELLLALCLESEDDSELVQSAYRWVLARKGLAIDLACRLQAIKQSMSHRPDFVAALDEIRDLRRSISESALVDAEDAESKREFAQNRIAELQELLDQKVREAGIQSTEVGVSVAAIRSELPPGSALLEFVVTRLTKLQLPANETTPPHVLAFFVPSDSDESCRLVDLGPAEEIDNLLDSLRDQIERLPRLLRLQSEAELEANFQSSSFTLHEKLLGPFRDELAEVDQLVFALDGALHKLPVAALSPAPGRYLVEDYVISHISSGRDLLRAPSEVGSGSLILADPDYDASPEDRLDSISTIAEVPDLSDLANGDASAGEMRSLRWRPLPGARQEAAEVSELLDVAKYLPLRVFVGGRAVEEILKSTISPRLVHIATHGFYVPRASESEPSLALRGASTGTRLGRLGQDDNPLLRSGIILAGANNLEPPKQGSAHVDDGWVTAQEIASLDFRNTELVVLSACESGLGEAMASHGVHGLRRALLIAGAHNVMTSLFEVPDAETRELMVSFYAALVQGEVPSVALRSAQRAMILRRRGMNAENGIPENSSAAGEVAAAHPFYWASFFVLGKPSAKIP